MAFVRKRQHRVTDIEIAGKIRTLFDEPDRRFAGRIVDDFSRLKSETLAYTRTEGLGKRLLGGKSGREEQSRAVTPLEFVAFAIGQYAAYETLAES